MFGYYCPECGTELEETWHCHAGNYVAHSYGCPKCGAMFDYDSRCNPPWKGKRPLYEKPKPGEVPVVKRKFKVHISDQEVEVVAFYPDDAKDRAREKAKCEIKSSKVVK